MLVYLGPLCARCTSGHAVPFAVVVSENDSAVGRLAALATARTERAVMDSRDAYARARTAASGLPPLCSLLDGQFSVA